MEDIRGCCRLGIGVARKSTVQEVERIELFLRWVVPNMHDGVASPWPPRLGHFVGLLRAHSAEVIAYADVPRRKGIRPARRAHRDVMRGPLPNARECDQLFDVGFRRRSSVELQCARLKGSRQGNDARRPCADDAEFGDIINAGPGDSCGEWRESREFL